MRIILIGIIMFLTLPLTGQEEPKIPDPPPVGILGIQAPSKYNLMAGLHVLCISEAFEEFRKDQEGFAASLAEYSIVYGVLPHSYKGHDRVILIEFKHIQMTEDRKFSKGYGTGEYGVFIVDMDTLKVLNQRRYFE